MKPGQVIEAAVWIDGTETREQREKFEAEVRQNIAEVCGDYGLVHGPVVFMEKQIGDERVPMPPDHIQGPDVRLLVAEARLVAFYEPEGGFVHELDRKDLLRLRDLTRQAHAINRPGERLTDMECDDLINKLGPDVAVDTLRRM